MHHGIRHNQEYKIFLNNLKCLMRVKMNCQIHHIDALYEINNQETPSNSEQKEKRVN